MIGPIQIQLQGLNELMRIAQINLGPTFRAILHEVGEIVKKEISHPPNPVHTPIRWVSAKQRRAYFAKRKGLGPWQRETDSQSEQLLASWKIDDETDYRIKVYNTASYGPWVQSADMPGGQQPFHADTGWRTDEGVIQIVSMSREVERIAGEQVGKVLEGR